MLLRVWKSDEKLVIFASLISPSKIILFDKQYQAFDSVSSPDETAQSSSKILRRIFNSLLGVSSCDETLHLMLDILLLLFHGIPVQ